MTCEKKCPFTNVSCRLEAGHKGDHEIAPTPQEHAKATDKLKNLLSLPTFEASVRIDGTAGRHQGFLYYGQ